MKICKCLKCGSEFEMPDNFYKMIICENCDPAMNTDLKEEVMYYFARNNGLEGWSLEECETLEQLKEKIKFETYGSNFKLFKELDFKIIDEEKAV